MLDKNNVNKEVANSLNKYVEYGNKGSNAILDGVNQINKWYEEQLDKMSEGEFLSSRLTTNVDVSSQDLETTENEEISVSKIRTKVDSYNELQTKNKNNCNIIKKTNKISTQASNVEIDEDKEVMRSGKESEENQEIFKSKTSHKTSKISTVIKVAKTINNTTNKVIKTGKSINTGLNEGEFKSFEKNSSKIMTRSVRKVSNKVSSKATNMIAKRTQKMNRQGISQKSSNAFPKVVKVITRLIVDTIKLTLLMLPSIVPIIIIIIIVACLCSFFGLSMSESTRIKYEQYMINTQNEYDKTTVEFYNQGNIVENAIEGKGMIDWRAPLSIIQMLNGDLIFDDTEKELLNSFKNAGLFEKITDISYTYEKDVEVTDKDGNTTMQKQNITEIKKVVTNPSLEDFINWCNNNFSVINRYKNKKKLKYDLKQTSFTDNEIEQIKLLYNSNSFFDLFSDNFKNTYAYTYVNIRDEQLQAIYNEFLKNAGKRYLMDHSNLKYDECMEYYDCSSWVIHCFAHCGIKTIPNTGAQGIYNNYCYPISVNDRKAGDLIFLKDTYNTGQLGSISHVGIYMGELTINGETNEWVIDTRRQSIRSTN